MISELGRIASSLLVVGSLLGAAACSQPSPTPDEGAAERATKTSKTSERVDVHVLSFNDFHGHLKTPGGKLTVDGETIDAGGAAHLAHAISGARETYEHTAVVVAGDLIGASPFVSANAHDEPTIDVFNSIGLDAVAVGNHEFDEGWKELRRISDGGCHPEEGCPGPETYQGANFPFLAANVLGPDGETLFDPYIVKEFDGEKVAFLGLALDGVPSLVMPSGIEGLTFRGEVETIDEYVPKLQKKGIESIVVVVHEGGYPKEKRKRLDGCPGLEGPIVEIAEEASDAVDAYLTGHTHQIYNCRIDGKVVTSAKSYGRLLTRLHLAIDPTSGDVVEAKATHIPVRSDSPGDRAIASLVEKHAERAADKAEEPVGRIAESLSRSPAESGESELGRVIADSQLAATTAEGTGNADVAFMNPGGIREPLTYEPADEEDEEDVPDDDEDEEEEDDDAEMEDQPGAVTYGDLHRVQPFGNQLIVMTLTGKQIHRLLEQQWRGQGHPRVLQVSANSSYTWHPNRKPGNRVDPADVTINGKPLKMKETYRVTVNNYLAEGGDNFSVLKKGKDLHYGELDVEVLADYFEENSPVEPGTDTRIRRKGAGQ